MKTYINISAIICAAVLIISCTSTNDEIQPEPKPSVEKPDATEPAEFIFSTAGGRFWLRYQKDPYELTNIQAAYDSLHAKASASSENAVYSEFACERELQPTHCAVRFYPKTKKQMNAIRMLNFNEGLNVSYHPFDYVVLYATDAAELCSGITDTVYAETNPYCVPDYNSDGEIEKEIPLPLFYVVWPYDGRSLPDSIEYKKDYEVLLTNYGKPEPYNGLSAEAAQILKREAERLVRESD